MMPEVLVGLLAEPVRMRVFAAVVLGATTPAEVAGSANLTTREVVEALRRLADGGLVNGTAPLFARLDAFKEAARERAAAQPAPDQPLDGDRTKAAVLRTFLVDGRLVSFPAARSRRRIILEHIVATFEPGVRYPEREVNAILRAWHDDYATLRRYLIDEDLLNRDGGVYWRIGGPVPL